MPKYYKSGKGYYYKFTKSNNTIQVHVSKPALIQEISGNGDVITLQDSTELEFNDAVKKALHNMGLSKVLK